MAPRSGPGHSERGGGGKSDGWASLSAGCTFLRPHELFNCPFFSGFPDGCSGHRPPRPSSWGRGSAFGVLAGSQFYPVDMELPAPLSAPSTLSNPGCFGSLAGGRGGQKRALPYDFLPQVLFHSRARALTLSPKSAPTHLAQCQCCSDGSAHLWEVSP